MDNIPFNGFEEVINLLKYADKNLRERILRNVYQKDPELARRIIKTMQKSIDEETLLERQAVRKMAENRNNIRNYGH